MRQLMVTAVTLCLVGCSNQRGYQVHQAHRDYGAPVGGNQQIDPGVQPADHSYPGGDVAPAAAQVPPEIAQHQNQYRQQRGVLPWLRSGRGIAWGSARNGPARDPGLDRIMVDTLGSSRPSFSRPQGSNAPTTKSDADWVYP